MKSYGFPWLKRWVWTCVAALALAGYLQVMIADGGGGPEEGTTAQGKLNALGAFTSQVWNGHANQITGVFAEGVFALPVVQQPAGEPAFISSLPDSLTQFASASAYGSLGFIAHNTLAGRLFSGLQVGNTFTIIYGDGSQRLYQVIQVRHFKATDPTSTTSSYLDLDQGSLLSYRDLFLQTYAHQGWAVLQTCIAADGIDSWGRLFIIATPSLPVPSNMRSALNIQ